MKQIVRKTVYTTQEIEHQLFFMEDFVKIMTELRDEHFEKCGGKIAKESMKFEIGHDRGYDYCTVELQLSNSVELMETDKEYELRLKREKRELERDKRELKRLRAKFENKEEGN